MNNKFDRSELLNIDIEKYLHNFLLNIEKKIDLKNSGDEFLCLWARLRQIISDSIISEITTRQNSADSGLQEYQLVAPSKKKRMIFKVSVLKSLIFRNPFLTVKKGRIIIFSNSRRVKNTNSGFYEDLYSEPLYKYFKNNDTYLIEEPWLNYHKEPVRFEVKHGDAIMYLSYLLGILSYRFLNSETLTKIKFIENQIAEVFDLNMNIKPFAKKTWLKRKGSFLAYKLLFIWLKPKSIFYVSLNTDTAMVEAARALGIKTAELQHGILGRHITSDTRSTQKVAPDYLLTFGGFWSEEIHTHRPKKIIIGFEYLNEERKKYPLKKEKQIFIISDGSLAMAKLAIQLSKSHADYRIVFKLKPTEFSHWKIKYKILDDNSDSLVVIDSDELSNYELLSKSEYQVGGCSMLLMEGITFNCRTVVVRGPGYSYLERLVSKGYAIIGNYDGEFDLTRAPKPDLEQIEHLFNSKSGLYLSKFLKELAQ